MPQHMVHNYTCSIILSSMPCSLCRSWEMNPSWHRCDEACVITQGTAKLHTGEEIRCSKARDGTWWFFFCNQCKKNRPHIIGVLRRARILRCPYSGRTDYTTDSENASYSYSYSEDESYMESEEGNRAIECLSTLSITETLCINLTAYTEIKLYRACKAIYLGNQTRSKWWANMNRKIQIACGKNINSSSSSSDRAHE